jgi:hypothetical protein
MSLLKDYAAIHSAWESGTSSSDIYQMIQDWINDHQPQEVYPAMTAEIEEWLYRADHNVGTNDLVDDFVYGKVCATIRDILGKQDIAK